MKQKINHIDGLLKGAMGIAGIVLIVLLLGKAEEMSGWRRDTKSSNGKYKAAQCLVGLWDYAYPVKSGSEQIRSDDAGGQAKEEISPVAQWITWIWEYNPIFRFLEAEKEQRTVYHDMDPAYSSYQENQEFYQEHQYLLYYGDEESDQEVPQESVAQAAPEPLQAAALHNQSSKLPVLGTQYMMEQLADYDFLMKYFYNVHTSTTATREEMNAETLVGMDLTIEKDSSQPQILIYHTHSQEAFADYGPDNQEATVVGVGSYLAKLLEAKGYGVIHHTGVYDLKDGQLDRSKAYTYALDGITGILQQYPSIQVVLDVHRDGVKEGLHLVSEVNGKPTAPIMFFNGMSQTPTETIEYLQNPYKEENLAFSLQMQLDAAAYFPGLTRKIYLKGLRYNLHLRPRSSLIEVGAQTNTYQEALNAMEPLSELLDMVLQGD